MGGLYLFYYFIAVSSSIISVLRSWDLRLPFTHTNNNTYFSNVKPTNSTTADPTTLNGSRPRGIISLAQGTGPTAGLLFALAADTHIHTYSTSPTLNPLSSHTFSHENMQTNSFYVRIATSPCGRWLASGGAQAGSAFLYDIGNAARMSTAYGYKGHSSGVQLRGQTGEVAAVDWADGILATCADDGTVRVWRPDEEVKRRCAKDPEGLKWDYAWSVG
jgi:denticleless